VLKFCVCATGKPHERLIQRKGRNRALLFLTGNFPDAIFNGFSDADLENVFAYMKQHNIGALDTNSSFKLVVMLTNAGVRIVEQ
jgi:hypothetical protein